MTDNLNFHETFKPELQYISSIVSISDGVTWYTVKDISSLTGIPNGESSGKVRPHILYSDYMGLIRYEKKDQTYRLERTSLGKIVYEQDPGFQEKLTQLLCHLMLCRADKGASMWNKVFVDIMPRYSCSISKDILLLELNKLLDNKINKKNFAPFLVSYEEAFYDLNLINLNGDIVAANPHQYNNEYLYVYAYFIYVLWDALYPDEDEITGNQFDSLTFGSYLNLDFKKSYEILEHLSDAGIIRLNRQLTPYTLLRLTTKEELETRLYDNLI